MDAATLADHVSIIENTTISVSEVNSAANMPVQVACPYKYALSCEAELDASLSDANAD